MSRPVKSIESYVRDFLEKARMDRKEFEKSGLRLAPCQCGAPDCSGWTVVADSINEKGPLENEQKQQT